MEERIETYNLYSDDSFQLYIVFRNRIADYRENEKDPVFGISFRTRRLFPVLQSVYVFLHSGDVPLETAFDALKNLGSFCACAACSFFCAEP